MFNIDNYKKTHYIVSEEDFKRIKNIQNKELTIEDYNKLFTDDTLFKVVENMPYDQDKLTVVASKGKDYKPLVCRVTASKVDIIRKAHLVKNELSDIAKERCEKLYQENLFNPSKIKEYVYDTLVNGTTKSFRISDFCFFMNQMKNDYLKDEVQHKYNDTAFLYAFLEFYKERLEKNYVLDDEVVNAVDIVRKYYDVSAYKIHDFGNSGLIKDCHINETYKQMILDEIPSHMRPLDKSLYLYFLLCRDFYYDSNVYAEEEKGPVTKKHQDPAYIETLGFENKAVVCYSFTALYAKFLEELGIKYEIKTKDNFGKIMDPDKYGHGHQFINVLVPPYNFALDSTTGVLETDLYNVKMKNDLCGILLFNDNRLKENFDDRIDFVRNEFHNRSLKENDTNLLRDYDKIRIEFEELDKQNQYSIDEKLEILQNFVIKCENLDGMEAFSAFVNLRKIIFTPEEMRKNVYLRIVGYNETESPKKEPVIVLAKNDVDYKYNSQKNEYSFFRPGRKAQSLSKEDLEFLIDEGYFFGIKEGLDIPGINIYNFDNQSKEKTLWIRKSIMESL